MTKLEIQTGASPEGLRFQINDEKSSMKLAEFKLDAAQLWEILRGGYIHVEGEVGQHPERIGKTMVTDSVDVPKDIAREVGYGQSFEAAENWARTYYPDWDTYTGRRHGGGTGRVSVTMRKWVRD